MLDAKVEQLSHSETVFLDCLKQMESNKYGSPQFTQYQRYAISILQWMVFHKPTEIYDKHMVMYVDMINKKTKELEQ